MKPLFDVFICAAFDALFQLTFSLHCLETANWDDYCNGH